MQKKPTVNVNLIGEEEAEILEKVSKALKQAGQEEEAKKYLREATSGGYRELVRATLKYVEVE